MKRSGNAEPQLFNRIAALRADRGLSRQQVAEAIGVHYQTVGYLERGEYNPSLMIALQLAKLFNLPIEEIFSLTPLPLLSERFAHTTKT